ncbi:MAG: PQQ-binding-like beta-propeller repeat protein [Candidatus Poribacteria bacterium]|nr:PQQ-binding-like beta-propeller repeat protein [Candidatus Poribacteria bacterium]
MTRIRTILALFLFMFSTSAVFSQAADEKAGQRIEGIEAQAEANEMYFEKAKRHMIRGEYELAIEAYQSYMEKSKPFRQLKWKREFQQPPLSPLNLAYRPRLHAGTIYVASWADSHSDKGRVYRFDLYAIDTDTGDIQWQFEKEIRIDFMAVTLRPHLANPLVVLNGALYAPLSNTHIAALDANTGALLWEYEHERWRGEVVDFEWPSPRVTAGVVCTKFYDGVVVAISAETGEVKWRYDTGIGEVESILASEGTVYLGAKTGLIGIDAKSGERHWRAKMEGLFTLPLPWFRLAFMDSADLKAWIPDWRTTQQEMAKAFLSQMSEEQVEEWKQQQERSLQPYKGLPTSGVVVMSDDSHYNTTPRSGLQRADLILEVDGAPVADRNELFLTLRKGKTEVTRTLKILRGGSELSITVEQRNATSTEFAVPIIISESGNLLYVTQPNPIAGSISAVSKASGDIRWEYRGAVMGSVVVPQKSVLALGQRQLYALHPETGIVQWKAEGISTIPFGGASPLIANGKVYMLRHVPPKTLLRALLLDTGESVWELAVAEPPLTQFGGLKTVHETTLYTFSFVQMGAAGRPNLEARSAETGEVLWQFPIAEQEGNADVLVGEDGTTYLVTDVTQQNLRSVYALNPKPEGLGRGQGEHESLLGIGTALVALGRYEDAIPRLRDALALRADLMEAHWQLALAFEGLKRWDEAAKERNEYLAQTPFDTAPPEVKKHLYDRFGIQKWMVQGERGFDVEMTTEPRQLNSTSTRRHGLRWGVSQPTVMEGWMHRFGGKRGGGGASLMEGEMETAIPKWVKERRRSQYPSDPPWDRGISYDGQIYIQEITDRSYTLNAFSSETGEALWKFEAEEDTSDPIFSSVLLVSDKVYWGTGGRLYALDKKTGTTQWVFSDDATPELFPMRITRQPIMGIPDDLVELPQDRFMTELESRGHVALASTEDSVYIVNQESVFAISSQTGEPLWKQSIHDVRQLLGGAAGRLFVQALGENRGMMLYALRTDSGKVDWMTEWEGKEGFYGSEHVFDETRIYLKEADTLRAFSIATGELQWEFGSQIGAAWNVLVVGDKAVYLRGSPFYALDKTTGTVKWAMNGFGPNHSTIPQTCFEAQIKDPDYPEIPRHVLYLGSGYRLLYVLDLNQIEQLRAQGKRWWTDL